MARRALVTGGNRGIGRAVAAGLVRRGHDVVIGARDGAKGAKVAADIGATHVVLDLDRPETIAAGLEGITGFDILINNAGVLFERPMLSNPGDFASSMAVMVQAPYELIRLLSPRMAQLRYGRIVNVSSDWGSFSEGLGGPGAYGVAKAALNALTVTVARELPSCVKVNAMCPGWVRTRMGGTGASRSPEEGAETALWLAALPEDGPTGGFFRDQTPLDW
ncbi:SDR family NAD(P)-dependent oxidoreductase [Alisedimentitalea sp. MJ-SS2]|uniref:SDR family NAD(P)-dependent oxidoreductase n=1 Tax=Aliisedimentitalea sp. MJ-SS2 TaxID=3049795 RepID=UPI002910E569|nr:SDR family NAD(P)-dependent oxidoreductase [Alisedimentitalea sp. MJ-SS2]MDU8926314.1 SDR family NAD(P)-dependent oxidoreductase [Alisedimentitalea sp. MJ-SS2]